MSSTLPAPFLFRFAFPAAKVAGLPRSGGRLLDLPAECALRGPAETLARGAAFGEVRVAWNDAGFGVSVEVREKKLPVSCDPRQPTESDGLQVWIDTRNTQSIHRASRYCHHFCLLPAGGGKKGESPAAIHLPIARAREETPPADVSRIALKGVRERDGYVLEAWFPAAALNGYDPEASPRLGFYYALRDAELGEQYLSVGPEFPISHDPSLWATLELSR